jgi:hypothetical protein
VLSASAKPQAAKATAGPAWLVAGCVLLWLLGRPALVGLLGSLSTERWDTSLLRVYLGFLLVRGELLGLFVGLTAGAAVLALLPWQATILRRWGSLLAMTAVALPPGVYLYALAGGRSHVGMLVVPTTTLWRVGPEDVELTAWIDDNIPPQETIGLQAHTFRAGPSSRECHLFPYGGALAVVLHGKHANYRFFEATERPGAYEDYQRNVEDSLNVAWCLRNGIHYFYVTEADARLNPGLHRAVAEGKLREVHRVGSSAVYRVSPTEQ